MPSPTWTPAALLSEAVRLAGKCWRLVEAQHRVSTLKVTDTLTEQQILENAIEESKLTVPPECRHLDYLLFTPFRYGNYPHGSRFRRAARTPGVFYAAGSIETAVAEMAFYRLLFYVESPDTAWPSDAAEYTAFATAYSADRAIDLARPPLEADTASWADPIDYAACHALADNVREAEISAIRYPSVRDPQKGANIALLTCGAFAKPKPLERRTWRVRLSAVGVQALCEFPIQRMEFGPAAFAADPRIKRLKWDRD